MIDPLFESVVAQEDSAFRCVHLRCEHFVEDHAWHYHPQYELLWVIQSHGSRFVGDSIERYAPGDLVLTGPNLPHCYRNDASGDQPEWIVLQFDADCLGEAFLTLPEARPLRRLLADANCGLSFDLATSDHVGALLRSLVVQSGMRRLIVLLEILQVLASAEDVTKLSTAGYQLENDIDKTHLERIEAVQAYIHERLGGQISQAEIADRLGLSASAFSKFFRAATGRTFMGLVKMLRVNEACRLLSTGDARITDIALECGYSHTSHFDQQFAEVKGMSPSEYRRRLRLVAAGNPRAPIQSVHG